MLPRTILPQRAAELAYIPEKGRGGQGESAGKRQTPPWVNGKTPLAGIAINTRTPIGHNALHVVG